MVITPNHPQVARFRVMKGSSLLHQLVRLDTDTGEYIRMSGSETEEGVADRVLFLAPSSRTWEVING